MAMLPFAPWLPDTPNFAPDVGSAIDARNVIPGVEGYKPFPDLVTTSTPVSSKVYGAASFASSGGSIFNFCGTATKLYIMASDGLGWQDATRVVGGNYTHVDANFWTFSQYDDYVFAQNGYDVCQMFLMDVATAFSNQATVPTGHYTGTIRGFSFSARTETSGREIAWSGVYSPLDYVPSDVTMADSQVLPDGGDIQAVVGGEIGVIFQRRGITRMTFSGPPLTFTFDKVSTTLGCLSERSVAAYGDLIFFLSENGFHMIRGGTDIIPIGENKVDKWVLDRINLSQLGNVSSAIKPDSKIYVIAIPTDRDDGVCDTLLVYHWPTGKWSYATIATEVIFQGISQHGYNIDTVDALNPNPPNTTGIDGMHFSFDDGFLIGAGNLSLSAFDHTHTNGFFVGQPMVATVTTGDIQLTEGKKSLVLGARPMLEGNPSSILLQPFIKDRLQQSSVRAHEPVEPNYKGICPLRASGRYHRFTLIVKCFDSDANWSYLLGVDDIKAIPQSA